ncbi:MAG: hypothetical protein IT302_10035 [Dehalococcoidia bacterium]|nr:hypothetical protein [Dehalococcoidia bacterium]
MNQHPTDGGEQHALPATSRTEPSSHGDPGRFFANHPPVLWRLFAVLGVLVVVGMIGVYFVVSNSDGSNERGEPPGVSARGEQTAVAAEGIGATSVTVGQQFSPASLIVPRGGQAIIAIDGNAGACALKNNEDRVAALGSGESYTFDARTPGEFRFSCDGQPARGQLTLTVP